MSRAPSPSFSKYTTSSWAKEEKAVSPASRRFLSLGSPRRKPFPLRSDGGSAAANRSKSAPVSARQRSGDIPEHWPRAPAQTVNRRSSRFRWSLPWVEGDRGRGVGVLTARAIRNPELHLEKPRLRSRDVGPMQHLPQDPREPRPFRWTVRVGDRVPDAEVTARIQL